jgi:hypothetical protein
VCVAPSRYLLSSFALSRSAMSANLSSSKENHFVQLVSTRLRSAMANPDYWCMDDDVSHIGLELPVFSDSDNVHLHHRLTVLETTVLRMENKLNVIVDALCPAAGSSESRNVAVHHSPKVQLPNCPLSPVRRVPGRLDVASGTSSSSPSASPGRFQFVCPLCNKPQFTPKSHCEHLRNVVDDGNHLCRFVADYPLHDRIISLWGSSDHFVRWYCSFLRSGMGSKFTENDMRDYHEVQQAMQNVLSGAVRLQL